MRSNASLSFDIGCKGRGVVGGKMQIPLSHRRSTKLRFYTQMNSSLHTEKFQENFAIINKVLVGLSCKLTATENVKCY